MAFLVLPSKIAPGRLCATGFSSSLANQGIGICMELSVAWAFCVSAFLRAALPGPSAPFKKPFVWSFIPHSLLISRCLWWADGVMSLFSHPVCSCAPHLFLLTLISVPFTQSCSSSVGVRESPVSSHFTDPQLLSDRCLKVHCADQAGLTLLLGHNFLPQGSAAVSGVQKCERDSVRAGNSA